MKLFRFLFLVVAPFAVTVCGPADFGHGNGQVVHAAQVGQDLSLDGSLLPFGLGQFGVEFGRNLDRYGRVGHVVPETKEPRLVRPGKIVAGRLVENRHSTECITVWAVTAFKAQAGVEVSSDLRPVQLESTVRQIAVVQNGVHPHLQRFQIREPIEAFFGTISFVVRSDVLSKFFPSDAHAGMVHVERRGILRQAFLGVLQSVFFTASVSNICLAVDGQNALSQFIVSFGIPVDYSRCHRSVLSGEKTGAANTPWVESVHSLEIDSTDCLVFDEQGELIGVAVQSHLDSRDKRIARVNQNCNHSRQCSQVLMNLIHRAGRLNVVSHQKCHSRAPCLGIVAVTEDYYRELFSDGKPESGRIRNNSQEILLEPAQ